MNINVWDRIHEHTDRHDHHDHHDHHHQNHNVDDDDDDQASGELWALDDNKLMVKNFNYDGAGPDAFFWVTFISIIITIVIFITRKNDEA